MTKMSSAENESVVIAFNQHNQARSQRTVQLTRQAIAKLKAAGQKITLSAVSEATRVFDESGKGLAPNTILRNLEARELFHQESPSYRQRQQRLGKIKRRRSRSGAISKPHAEYRGLPPSDLVQIIERLNQSVAKLQEQLSKHQAERDVAYRCCARLQQQNVRQLAALTILKQSSPPELFPRDAVPRVPPLR